MPAKERSPPNTATLRIPSWSAAMDEIIDIKNVINSVIDAINAVNKKSNH